MPSLETPPSTPSTQSITSVDLPPLPQARPLLMIGHGTKNVAGRQALIDFAAQYEALDPCRPVIPCFLELTEPTILEGVERCIQEGYTDLSALPILLFAARHNKFDVTNELDRARRLHPQVQFHYGRHFGITPTILELWQERLAQLDQPEHNPHQIPRADTVLLFIGRGSSDPDANGDVAKLARMVWEGSGYQTVETCFIGITHPRLEEGFRRARFYQPKRIIVLPYFLFTGTLMEKIQRITAEQQAAFPEIEIAELPEMGIHPYLFRVIRDREIETQTGQVNMNCEMCKFRLAALGGVAPGEQGQDHGHHHDHHHTHEHGHSHHHHSAPDPYAEPEKYHDRIWQVP
ncbi:MAG: sirohydrochlorin chelatase [Spirulina sp. SIO3F2]|nr:sirohydrochlorin chelatase [Spirulina sp. SIO3F2]